MESCLSEETGADEERTTEETEADEERTTEETGADEERATEDETEELTEPQLPASGLHPVPQWSLEAPQYPY